MRYGKISVEGSLDVTGSMGTVTGLSGSLTRLADGTSYLIAGTNVTITSASNGAVTISAAGGGGGGGGDPAAEYLVLTATGSLTNERAFAAGTGISTSDGGAGNSFTVSIDDSVVATVSGTTFTGVTNHNAGLSGSLTQLTDGTSYLIAGTNVTITSASNGSVVIDSTAVAGVSFFDSAVNGSIYTSGSAAFVGGGDEWSVVTSPADKGTDVFFYVSGSINGSGVDDKKSVFGGDVRISGSLSVDGPYLLNIQSGTLGSEPVVLLVSASHHFTVFTLNNVTASLPTTAPVGTQLIFKDGTGMASTSPQMLSCSVGGIDNVATFTLPAINYTSVTVVKADDLNTWMVV